SSREKREKLFGSVFPTRGPKARSTASGHHHDVNVRSHGGLLPFLRRAIYCYAAARVALWHGDVCAVQPIRNWCLVAVLRYTEDDGSASNAPLALWGSGSSLAPRPR